MLKYLLLYVFLILKPTGIIHTYEYWCFVSIGCTSLYVWIIFYMSLLGEDSNTSMRITVKKYK